MIEPLGIEREIKFRLPEGKDPASLREAVESAGFRLEPAGTIAQEDRYLDTPDWALYRGGLALRLRAEGMRLRLEAKTLGDQNDGALIREEWAQDAPKVDPPWTAVDPGPVAAILQPMAGLRVLERLQVRARVTNERECFRWLRGDALVGLLTVDHVSAPPAQFREVELELKNGADEALGEVRRAVEERLGLTHAVQTKLMAALAASGERLPERDERAFALGPADRLVDVAYKTFGRHLGKLQWNEAGARLGVDIEYLHDMRVAVRRLRTALEVLAEGYPDAVRDIDTELRWIGRGLGRVRDLDVSLMRVASLEADSLPFERAAVRVFAQSLWVRRARRRLRMVERLDSDRFRSFVDKARSWIDAGTPAATQVPQGVMPAYSAAARIITKWMGALAQAYETAHRTMDPEDLHTLRIAAKKARYSYEYFAELEGPVALKRAKRLAALQDYLGDHMDTLILLRRLRRYAGTIPRRDAELTLGAGSVLGNLERAARVKRSELRNHWEKATAE